MQTRIEIAARKADLLRTIAELDKPVVCAVHGFAFGGGFMLAIGCDVVVTAVDALWGLPEVGLGFFPPWGIEALARRVTAARARAQLVGRDPPYRSRRCALGSLKKKRRRMLCLSRRARAAEPPGRNCPRRRCSRPSDYSVKTCLCLAWTQLRAKCTGATLKQVQWTLAGSKAGQVECCPRNPRRSASRMLKTWVERTRIGHPTHPTSPRGRCLRDRRDRARASVAQKSIDISSRSASVTANTGSGSHLRAAFG